MFSLSFNLDTFGPSIIETFVNLVLLLVKLGVQRKTSLAVVAKLDDFTLTADHSLFINCGGVRTKLNGNEYEGDSTGEGPSYFFAFSDRWAYTSLGLFLTKEDVNFVATQEFPSNMINEDIYKTARLAPNSLIYIYYGFCMRQGSYKLRMHFAEIMFSNDSTYSSLGRRLFDVRIQVSQRPIPADDVTW
nr:probable LRR receptor-like serine/threonine-protein kinase At1g53430 [Ipomoea batatas]